MLAWASAGRIHFLLQESGWQFKVGSEALWAWGSTLVLLGVSWLFDIMES